jgi:hypothetical protein
LAAAGFELWTQDDPIELMLFAEASPDKAREVFADCGGTGRRRG